MDGPREEIEEKEAEITTAEQVRRLAADAADTAERRAVMKDMDAVTAAWPE